jgi:23S rRNA (adenine2030-N6)-methyltransferase
MNGSGLLLLNPPFGFDAALVPALDVLADRLGNAAPRPRVAWLRAPA